MQTGHREMPLKLQPVLQRLTTSSPSSSPFIGPCTYAAVEVFLRKRNQAFIGLDPSAGQGDLPGSDRNPNSDSTAHGISRIEVWPRQAVPSLESLFQEIVIRMS